MEERRLIAGSTSKLIRAERKKRSKRCDAMLRSSDADENDIAKGDNSSHPNIIWNRDKAMRAGEGEGMDLASEPNGTCGWSRTNNYLLMEVEVKALVATPGAEPKNLIF